jgi:hypothetical protein
MTALDAAIAAHLDTIDWERLRALPSLCLHRTLLLGLADPIPMPSPMSEEEGAWVREHITPPARRLIDKGYPFGFDRWCYCQRGTCWNCLNRRCDLCVHRQQGGPDVADDAGAVTDSSGYMVARIVLRDDQKPCRWVCRCPCAKTGPAPDRPRRPRKNAHTPEASPEALPPEAPAADQDALFEVGQA